MYINTYLFSPKGLVFQNMLCESPLGVHEDLNANILCNVGEHWFCHMKLVSFSAFLKYSVPAINCACLLYLKFKHPKHECLGRLVIILSLFYAESLIQDEQIYEPT